MNQRKHRDQSTDHWSRTPAPPRPELPCTKTPNHLLQFCLDLADKSLSFYCNQHLCWQTCNPERELHLPPVEVGDLLGPYPPLLAAEAGSHPHVLRARDGVTIVLPERHRAVLLCQVRRLERIFILKPATKHRKNYSGWILWPAHLLCTPPCPVTSTHRDQTRSRRIHLVTEAGVCSPAMSAKGTSGK